MKVIGLDGREYTLITNPNKYPHRSEAACRSKIQYACGQLLRERFSTDVILEEVQIPGTKMYIDFFLPTRKVAIEVHGNQHDEYVPFFHGSRGGYIKSQHRDREKARWCEINSIEFHEVRTLAEMRELLGINNGQT